MNTLQDIARDAHTNSHIKGFWDGCNIRDPYVMAAKLCLIHSEVSEALEEARNESFEQYLPIAAKPEGVITELADIIIRVFDLAEEMRAEGMIKTTIQQAILYKMQFNAERTYKHGGKTI